MAMAMAMAMVIIMGIIKIYHDIYFRQVYELNLL